MDEIVKRNFSKLERELPGLCGRKSFREAWKGLPADMIPCVFDSRTGEILKLAELNGDAGKMFVASGQLVVRRKIVTSPFKIIYNVLHINVFDARPAISGEASKRLNYSFIEYNRTVGELE